MTDKVGTEKKAPTPLVLVEGCYWTTPDDNGNTPMHLAVPEGHCGIVTALLDLGAQVDVKNLNGETALHLAAKKGNEDMVKELLRAGADPLLKTTGGGTAWHIAAAAGHVGILKVLHAHVNVHKIEDSASPRDIQNAVVKGKEQTGTGKNYECPESASAEGKATVIDKSVHNNPEADRKDSEKDKKETGNKLAYEECLESTSAEGKGTVKDKSPCNHAEADRKDLTGKGIASSHTSRNLVPVLTSRNSSKEAPKNNSSNPDYFSDSEDDDVHEWVVSHAATLLRRNREVPPRRVLEVQKNILNSICCMANIDAHDIADLFERAVITGAEYSVQQLLKKGADVNTANSEGVTPLLLASVGGCPRIINILLKAGALTTIICDGLSVLHVAVKFRNLEAVRELLHKVSPNIRDIHGRTPLHLAAAEEENSIAIGQALIGAGAELSPRDDVGFTPLYVARIFSNIAFYKFLKYQHKASF